MKSFVLAAFLGAMTFTEVQSIRVSTEPGAIAHPTPIVLAVAEPVAPVLAAVKAAPAAAVDPKVAEAVKIVQANAGKPLTAEQEATVTKDIVESQQNALVKEAGSKTLDEEEKEVADVKEKEFKAETDAKKAAKPPKKTPEVQKAELEDKLKVLADEGKADRKDKEDQERTKLLNAKNDKEQRDWDLMDGFEAVVKGDKQAIADEAVAKEALRATSRSRLASLDDEEWVANMPSHILQGYEQYPHHDYSYLSLGEDEQDEQDDEDLDDDAEVNDEEDDENMDDLNDDQDDEEAEEAPVAKKTAQKKTAQKKTKSAKK